MNTKTLLYILKRILLALLTVWVVITITFFVMRAVPGGPFLSEKAVSEAAQKALEAKYGLSDGKTSVAGLVLYARELFGTQFRFDPTLSDEKGADGLSEVDKHILGYFTSMLYTAVTGLADDNVLPKLNFIMTRKLDNGKEGSNQTNVSNTTKKIGTAIDTILNPRLKGVTDGNYKLTAADKEMLDKAVEAAVKVVESAINDSDTTKRVEYATPDTLQADLRAYIESYYYRAALKLVAPTAWSSRWLSVP